MISVPDTKRIVGVEAGTAAMPSLGIMEHGINFEWLHFPFPPISTGPSMCIAACDSFEHEPFNTTSAGLLSGEGELVLTGQLGDVMKESAQAALGYARLESQSWGLAEGYFGKHDIHLHVPSGAVPKEGPSAGIAICTALISALREVPVRSIVAMTGEITLHGRVLPVGGVREKVLAAHRAGVTKLVLSEENRRDFHDLDEIPKQVHEDIEFVFVETMDEVLCEALVSE